MFNSECVLFQKIHCVIDVSLASVERLYKHQIYPIVLLIKFKSVKQIKEVKDTRYSTDKVSAKAAKEMYEHALKLESEYRQYISGMSHIVSLLNSCILVFSPCPYVTI